LKKEIEEGEVNAIRNPVVNYIKKARQEAFDAGKTHYDLRAMNI